MLPDRDEVARIVAAVGVSEVMPRFQNLLAGDIREKGPGDFVTVADEAAERHLATALGALLPGSRIVGEEAVAADPRHLDALLEDVPVWLIDPIDGTANFASGRPIFAMMVALVHRGETLMGWIHDPVAQSTAIAIRGEGAWRDGERMHVARLNADLASPLRGNRRLARRLGDHSPFAFTPFDLRCAGHEYLALAGGTAHFVLYNRLHPWDHAAGHLLHREAGGFSARLDGSPYTPRVTEGGLLLTPDEASWRALRRALIERP
jgi:fructose-1,6-bisphosphatase/inositol monophosphatase family enzyme